MRDVSLLVCDDSSMARKQLLRALPPDWPVTVTQAMDGRIGLEILRQGLTDLVFLDLTMPELDGYAMLRTIREESLRGKVIVVSGDVQAEALRRVAELGALAFLRKPVDPELLRSTLARLGLLRVGSGAGRQTAPALPSVSFHDTFREVVNIAMGQAAALLGRVLGVYVRLPVPNVNMLEMGELQMALTDARRDPRLTAICQGYTAGGISGEALLIFHDAKLADVARLMHWPGDQGTPMEMLLDLSCLLIGACLSGLAAQLNVSFSQGHPQMLGEHVPIEHLEPSRWQQTLAVEFAYRIEGHDIQFDLLLLFTEDSVALIRQKLAYLMD